MNTFRPCPKPPKAEKKQPKQIQRKTPLPKSTKPIAKSNKPIKSSGKPIRKKSSKLAKLEQERTTLTNGVCWKCGTPHGLDPHEIFFGRKNRTVSIKWKMVVDLCRQHHTDGSESVHHNKEFDDELKRWGQAKFVELFPGEDFRAIFGKNYL